MAVASRNLTRNNSNVNSATLANAMPASTINQSLANATKLQNTHHQQQQISPIVTKSGGDDDDEDNNDPIVQQLASIINYNNYNNQQPHVPIRSSYVGSKAKTPLELLAEQKAAKMRMVKPGAFSILNSK